MRTFMTAAVLLALAPGALAQVKISQVHAQSSVFNRDYVELFNTSSSPVSLSGWWLRTYWTFPYQESLLNLNGVIPAHSYFLVSVTSTGNGTADLPVAADLQGPLTLFSAHQRLDLMKPSLTEYGLISEVVWNNGGQPGNALPMDGTNALIRAEAGCVDGRINAWDFGYNQWDFDLGAPAPRNSADSHVCDFVGPDCNRNGIDDRDDITSDPTLDCDGNGRLNSCGGYIGQSWDCDNNGVPDCVAIRDGAPDANWNRRIDTCEGGVLIPAPVTVTVLPTGVAADTGSWAAAGAQSTTGPSFAVVRWDNAAIRAVIGPYGFGVPSLDLRELGADAAPGALDFFFTRNDSVVLTPGAAAPAFADLDALFGDRELLTTLDFRPHTVGAEQAPFLSRSTGCPAPMGSPTFHFLDHIWSAPVTTIVVVARDGAAAAFAGAANQSWPGPRLVFFNRQGPSCGSADFNGDGDVGTDSDIYAFFACIAGDCCVTCMCADFNGDGDVGTDADIEAFFRVLAGSC